VTAPTDTFFRPPNEIVPGQIQGAPAHLLETLRTRFERLGQRTLLPATVSGTIRWYGVAPSHRDGRLLRDEIRCWLSRPLTTGQVDVQRTTSDSVDQAALQLVPAGIVIRVDVARGWEAAVERNVGGLTGVWALEPARGIDQPRPVGRILRQFYESVVGNDRPQAEAALDELRGRALLGATNLRFLRVGMLSALGTPQELREDPSLKDISLLARPRAVTEALAEAADALVITPMIDSALDADLRSMAEGLETAWPALVTHSHQITNRPTARCYALGQSLQERPHERQLQELAGRYTHDPIISGVLQAVTVPQPPPQPTSPVPVTALSLFNNGEYEAALTMAITPPPDRSTAFIALAAAVSLRDPVAATRALAFVDQLSASDRSSLLASAVERSFVDSLQALTARERIPADWLDWLHGDWPDRPDLLAEWSQDWSRTAEYLAATADDLAGTLIDALNDSRRPRVRNGIALFVEWLTAGGVPPSAVGLATTVFDVMLSSEPGKTERQAALVVLEEVLTVGCTGREYGEIVKAVERQLPLIGPKDGLWLAQVVDLLTSHASPNPELRTTVIAQAAGIAQGWTDRIDPGDALVLHLLFRSANTEFSLPEKQDDAAQAVRPFRSVGIYSLMGSAIRVVTSWINQRWPDVTVKPSSEADNSKLLTSLAQGVDVMLVQTSHAKHAATAAIEVAITDPSRLVLVNGRGASSLMRALLEWTQVAPA
jgi:hypothetical protein